MLRMGKLRQRKTKVLVQDQLHCQWKDGGPGPQPSYLELLPLSPDGLPGDGAEWRVKDPKGRLLVCWRKGVQPNHGVSSPAPRRPAYGVDSPMPRSTELNCILGHSVGVPMSQNAHQ